MLQWWQLRPQNFLHPVDQHTLTASDGTTAEGHWKVASPLKHDFGGLLQNNDGQKLISMFVGPYLSYTIWHH